MQVIRQRKITARAQASFGGLCSVPAAPLSHPPYSPGSSQRRLCSFGTIWIFCLEMWASASKHGGRQRSRELKDSFSTSAKQEILFVENWAHGTNGPTTSATTRQCSQTTFDSAISSWRVAAT